MREKEYTSKRRGKNEIEKKRRGGRRDLESERLPGAGPHHNQHVKISQIGLNSFLSIEMNTKSKKCVNKGQNSQKKRETSPFISAHLLMRHESRVPKDVLVQPDQFRATFRL